jgi:hypothetical protein
MFPVLIYLCFVDFVVGYFYYYVDIIYGAFDFDIAIDVDLIVIIIYYL